MNFKNLLEEYKPKKNQYNGNTIEIWENPTQSEMYEAKKEYKDLRWVAFLKEKKVLIWDMQVTHAKVLNWFYNIDNYSSDKNILCGYIENGETESEMTRATRIKKYKYFDRDFSWIKKYIPNFEKSLTQLKIRVEDAYPIDEEFLFAYKERMFGKTSNKEKYFEIFVNPTLQEINSVAEEWETRTGGKIESFKIARGLADSDNKKVYVFSANLFHEYARKKIEKAGVKLGEKTARLVLIKKRRMWEIEQGEYKISKTVYGWIEDKSAIKFSKPD